MSLLKKRIVLLSYSRECHSRLLGVGIQHIGSNHNEDQIPCENAGAHIPDLLAMSALCCCTTWEVVDDDSRTEVLATQRGYPD